MYAAGMNCATLIYKSVQGAGAPAFGAHMAEKWGAHGGPSPTGYGLVRIASNTTIISSNTTTVA